MSIVIDSKTWSVMPLRKMASAVRHHALALALAFAAGLPCAVLAVQPPPERHPSAAATEAESAPALPDLRPTLHLLAGTDEPFDLSAFARPPSAADKWRLATSAMAQDRAVLAHCRNALQDCPAGALVALAIIEAARAKDGRARLAEVNRAVNLAIRYRSDAPRHGAPDAWAAPVATLTGGEGDCEDYALAKYLALRETGVAPQDLRLVLVRDARHGEDHAVLAARLDGRWILLDNRRFSLIEDRDAYSYRPVAALGQGAALFADGSEGRNARAGTAPRSPEIDRAD